MTGGRRYCMIAAMHLPPALSYLLDDAARAPGADAFLTALGDGSPTACHSPAVRSPRRRRTRS